MVYVEHAQYKPTAGVVQISGLAWVWQYILVWLTMWRYFNGVEEPPAKRTKSTEEKRQQGREYEQQKRKRSWNEKWLLGDGNKRREWLKFDGEEMYCDDCRKYATGDAKKKSPFVIGTQHFKLESIKYHEQSQGHQHCVSIAAANKAPPSTSIAEKTLVTLNRAQFEKMDKLFRTAHAIAKKGRPFTGFVWMCDLDEMKGLDIGKTYRNHTQAQNFISYIAMVERNNFQQELLSVGFLSLLSDGSTDSAVIEEEVVYAQYAKDGEIFVKFLGLQPVPKADALHITTAIKDVTSAALGIEEKEWKKKLVAVGSDGAAVMVGCRSGVVTRLTEDMPHVIGVHCMAHRLELSFKDAVSGNTCHKKLDGLLMGLYSFYHASPLNRANLKASYQILEQTPLMPTRIGGTRWVAHTLKALGNFLRGYAALIQHLEQIKSPDSEGVREEQRAKAKKLYKIAKSKDVVKYACFLFDVLDQLTTLSCNLQRTTASLAKGYRYMKTTKAVLEKYKTKAGPKLKVIEEETSYEGVDLLGNGESFVNSRIRLLQDLISSLENRMTDTSEGVVHATSVMDLALWPSPEHFGTFGDDHIDSLVEHFDRALQEAGVQTAKIADEWTAFKAGVHSDYSLSQVSQPSNWEEYIKSVTWAKLHKN